MFGSLLALLLGFHVMTFGNSVRLLADMAFQIMEGVVSKFTYWSGYGISTSSVCGLCDYMHRRARLVLVSHQYDNVSFKPGDACQVWIVCTSSTHFIYSNRTTTSYVSYMFVTSNSNGAGTPSWW